MTIFNTDICFYMYILIISSFSNYLDTTAFYFFVLQANLFLNQKSDI